MVGGADVVDYLVDVDFPASKDALVDEAARQGAPEPVLKALRAMPPVEYGSKAEVERSALRTSPAPLLPDGEAAERARSNDTSRLAKPER